MLSIYCTRKSENKYFSPTNFNLKLHAWIQAKVTWKYVRYTEFIAHFLGFIKSLEKYITLT